MSSLLEQAIVATLKAGKAIMKIYASDFEVDYKDDHSPLTLADKEANRIIESILSDTNIPIISEEMEVNAFSERKNWSRCWIVDPLDGTKEFVKRNGEFTVNIALVEQGIPVLGVIYAPVLKTLYYAQVGFNKGFKVILKDHDTSINDVFKQAQEIKPSTQPLKVRILGSRSHFNPQTKNFIKEIEKNNPVEIIKKGSSLKFCLIAEGKADYYPRFGPIMEWDTAAGQAICTAVGVSVKRIPEQIPLIYNKENLLVPDFLVSN